MNNKQEFNQSAYSVSHVVDAYSRMTSLSPAEVRGVAHCSRWICDADILDIGVGAGRTTAYLSPLARTYRVRDLAPDILLFANLGAIQLNYGYGIDECRRAVVSSKTRWRSAVVTGLNLFSAR